MKKHFVTTVILFLFSLLAHGQIRTQDEPVSFRADAPAISIDMEIMPPLDMRLIEEIDGIAGGHPLRIGFAHEVDYNLENSGEWIDLPDGSKLWRLEIFCPHALSINVLFDSFWLPEGAN